MHNMYISIIYLLYNILTVYRILYICVCVCVCVCVGLDNKLKKLLIFTNRHFVSIYCFFHSPYMFRLSHPSLPDNSNLDVEACK